MESKRTHFKMYKIGRRWAFDCAVILTLGSTAVAAQADETTSSTASTTSSVVDQASDQSSSDVSSSGSKAASQDEQQSNDQGTETTGAKKTTVKANAQGSETDTEQSHDSAADASSNESSVNEHSTKENSASQNSAKGSNTTGDEAKAQSTTQGEPVKSSSKPTTKAAKVAAMTTQLATPKSENSAVKDGGNVEDDYPDLHNLLGISSQFHIFAREAELNAHTNGNVAVETLIGNVNFGTNITEELLDKDISYIQNITNIANSSFVSKGNKRVNKVIFGKDIEIDVSNPNRPKVNGEYIDHLLAEEVYQDKNGNVYIDFDKEFAKLEKLSGSLSAINPHVNYNNSDFEDMNNRVIDVTDLEPDEDGHIIINLSADVLANSTPLTIKGLSADKDGHTVIINVDTEGNQDYHVNSQIKVIYDDGTERNNKETEDFGDNHLLWNFYDSTASDKLATGTISVDRPFQGSVLAPKAEIVANQNLDGNIIADKVVVNAETHRWDLQDNVDNKKDPDDFDKPVHPSIDVEMPNIEEPEGPEEPGEPEEPEGPEEPGEPEEPEVPEVPTAPVDVEEPDEETDGNTDEVIDEIEEEVEEELEAGNVTEDTVDELEDLFDLIEEEAVSDQIEDESNLLTLIDEAIKVAQAQHNTALVKQLTTLRAKVATALAQAKGQQLPQTGEATTQWLTLAGFGLASSLAVAAYGLRRHRVTE
ncbi:collagen-binding domain-containing protein [Lactiplantibacillus plajomi]|uniref:Collagen-binding domain-containing protein n=1 Tax=Lactiplantibacillus plajomi TaxID=1457217 RepID=A0ABV6K482_9LACO|nr:collagen-binding domain-containing protein [Lactiplantibacillus plajomi]